jgi:hypothetical protein
MANDQKVSAKTEQRRYCSQPAPIPIVLPEGTSPIRASAIRLAKNKWVNGTVLHYAFLECPEWDWPEAQKAVVRWAFGEWLGLGIGLRFEEVGDPAEAEIKIGRLDGDGSWSFVGTDILKNADRGRTMNFGWDLTTLWGHATALHEIGHTLGFQHEHQNPQSGLVWDEDKVYAHFLESDGWNRDSTYQNIIEKLSANGAQGSRWDPKSIMHYPFDPGLIKAPKPYDQKGIGENTKHSKQDKKWVLYWYPSSAKALPLQLMQVARFSGNAGDQIDFSFRPEASRDYHINAVGTADTKIVLFECRDGEPRHYDSEDDSGTAENAQITAKLVAGRDYIVRARLHYRPEGSEAGVLIF